MGKPPHKGSKMLYKRIVSSESKLRMRMIWKVTEKNSEFVESSQTKSDATRNAFVYERKRQKKTRQIAQTQELVGENPGLFSVKYESTTGLSHIITNNRVQVCSPLSAEKFKESFHWIHSRCAYTVVAFYVMLMNFDYSK